MTDDPHDDAVGPLDDPGTSGPTGGTRRSPGRPARRRATRSGQRRRASSPGRPREPGVVDVVVAGHKGNADVARRALSSEDPRIREVALGALARTGGLEETTVVEVLRTEPDPAVRRRACDVAATLDASDRLVAALRHVLGDPDPLVVEAACWALGERLAAADTDAGEDVDADDSGASARGHAIAPDGSVTRRVLDDLGDVARSHPDARVREAAVAAIGGIGDPLGLQTVLDALGDRPSVRRRAVVALAAFAGEDVVEALRRSAADRDWQVREVAEILLDDG